MVQLKRLMGLLRGTLLRPRERTGDTGDSCEGQRHETTGGGRIRNRILALSAEMNEMGTRPFGHATPPYTTCFILGVGYEISFYGHQLPSELFWMPIGGPISLVAAP